MQKQIVVALNKARQEAVSQKAPVIVRYDDMNKIMVTYNENYRALDDKRNRIVDLSACGLEKTCIVYGRPNALSELSLANASSMTEVMENSVDISFQPDGSVRDAVNNFQNKALFVYYKKHSEDAAFAVSVPGAEGRVTS